ETLIVADYRGLSVPAINKLRGELLEHGARFTVVKNTLTRRAAEEAGADALLALLDGATAIAFLETDGDPVAVAKALNAAVRETRVLEVRGGILDGQQIGQGDVASLATLPPTGRHPGRPAGRPGRRPTPCDAAADGRAPRPARERGQRPTDDGRRSVRRPAPRPGERDRRSHQAIGRAGPIRGGESRSTGVCGAGRNRNDRGSSLAGNRTGFRRYKFGRTRSGFGRGEGGVEMAKADTDKVVEQLGGMTVLELVELKNKLEEEWGVTAATPVAVAAAGAAPAAGGDGAAAEEKT